MHPMDGHGGARPRKRPWKGGGASVWTVLGTVGVFAAGLSAGLFFTHDDDRNPAKREAAASPVPPSAPSAASSSGGGDLSPPSRAAPPVDIDLVNADTSSIFHWVDKEGQHRLTNKPPPEGMELVEKLPARRSLAEAPERISTLPPSTSVPPAQKPPIVPAVASSRGMPNPYRDAALVGQKAPTFQTQNANGVTVDPVNERKPLWLTFSLKYCPPCKKQAGERNAASSKAAGVSFATLLEVNTPDDLVAYAKEYGLPAETVMFEPRTYAGGGYPFNAFVDGNGTIAYASGGYHSPDRIASIVNTNR